MDCAISTPDGWMTVALNAKYGAVYKRPVVGYHHAKRHLERNGVNLKVLRVYKRVADHPKRAVDGFGIQFENEVFSISNNVRAMRRTPRTTWTATQRKTRSERRQWSRRVLIGATAVCRALSAFSRSFR